MRRQPRIKQRRHPLQAKTVTKLLDCIERDSMRWNCSKSWIIATALAAFYGVDIVKPYEIKNKKIKPAVIKFRKRA